LFTLEHKFYTTRNHEVHQSPLSSAEVKNGWNYSSTTPICIHGVARNNFTLLLPFLQKTENIHYRELPFMEIVADDSENHVKKPHINCGQNAEILILNQVVHIVTTVL
jgi:hypothetical protein